jgi:Domain of unknown function (DUF6798)
MKSRWLAGLALLSLTLLGFFYYPGHTILQSDTQIYIPILQHIEDPTVLRNDIMAVRPHVSFTLYDEAALWLHRLTGFSFEQVLTGQQFIYRAVGLSGIYLFMIAAGLNPLMAWLATAILSLGANIMGPAVLIMEYEPVPRGFALPFLIFSLAMVARAEWRWAAVAATIAFAFHPPTAFAYAAILGLVLLWRKHFAALGLLAIGPLLIVITILLQPAPSERAPFFGVIDPSIEAIQRLRAAYNWVGMWAGKWMWFYIVLWIAGFAAWRRVRTNFSRELSLFLLSLPAIGIISVPLSYWLLDQKKWVLMPQFQPGRYLLFVTLIAMMLGCIAAIRAAERKRYFETFVFFVAPLIATGAEWDTEKLTALRLLLVCALALLVAAAAILRSPAWMVVVAGFIPFLVFPEIAGIQNYPAIHTGELDDLARWARENTSKDAVFQFADTGRRLEPGIFRVRAKRALYADWKSGGQVNFLKSFAETWGERWKIVSKPQPVDVYAKLGIDYVVFQSANRQPGHTPVFQNREWVVYDLRKESTSARDGMEACAPMRVTDKAAAALANCRLSSKDRPSVSATARAALKVSPAAVVSRASTANPRAWIVDSASA